MNGQTDILVELRGVRFRYPGAAGWALDGVDFALRRGEWVLLTGPTGCGKSTLLHCLQGLIPGELPGELRGEVVWHEGLGSDVNSNFRSSESRNYTSGPMYHAGLVFQNFEDQIIAATAEEEIAFGLDQLGLADEEKEWRVIEALELAGLGDCRAKGVADLSGGQRQRLVAASILAMRPALLLLDEPLSQMDDAAVECFLGLIERVRRERGMTVVMVEHRLAPVAAFATRQAAMRNGRVVSSTAAPVIFPARQDKPELAPAQKARDSAPALELKNLSFAYDGRPIIQNADVVFREGEMVALLGPNGCGKSTLLHLLTGLLRPRSGEVLWRGRALAAAQRARPSLVGLMLQNPDLMLLESTVAAEISPSKSHDAAGPWRDALLPDWRAMLERPPLALSRGQRLAVALLSVLAREPEILLLDEPSTGQDWEAIGRMMRALRGTRRVTIFTTHERRVAETFADRILWLEDGRIIELAAAAPAAGGGT